MRTRFFFLNMLPLVMTLNAAVGYAASPVVEPGLRQITIVDFADRTSVAKERVKTSDWGWWIVFAGSTASDESCSPPAARVDSDVVAITQAGKSVSAEITISQSVGGQLSANLTTSSVTPYGIAIPFHSTVEAQRLAANCP